MKKTKRKNMKFIPCKDVSNTRHFWDHVERIVDYAEPGKKTKFFSTMDLSKKLKLFPDYLGRRKARKKAREKAKQDNFYQVGNDVY